MSAEDRYQPVEPGRFRPARTKPTETGRARAFQEVTHADHDGVRLPGPTTMDVIDDYLRRTDPRQIKSIDRKEWGMKEGKPPKLSWRDEMRLRIQLFKVRRAVRKFVRR